VVLDLEDAVPADAKAESRTIVARVAAELRDGHPGLAVHVRVNAVPSEWFADDVASALVADIAGVVVPKLESAAQVGAVAEALDSRGLTELTIVAGLETAAGVARAEEVLADSRVQAAYFGAEDYIADMGGVHTAGNAEVSFARSQVALAGRLAGVPVLDQVVADFRDDERFVRESIEARAMGYAGKLCIHPVQVALANAHFVPSTEEIERAERLLAAYEEASAEGIAAIDFEGQMVDEPLATQARRVIALADDA
jgi:citrate lyase subunit beta/citryl-CoA lyase